MKERHIKVQSNSRTSSTAYSTFALLFYINRQKVKKNGLCPVMGRISVNAETASFSAGMEVDPALWDAKAFRVKGNSRSIIETNRRISELTERIDRYHREILEEQGYITAELVKNAVTGIGKKKECLLELFREHNEEYAAQVGITRVERSIRTYRAVYKQVERFLDVHYGMADIPLRQLDHSFVERFDAFLRIEQNLAPATVSGYTIILRKMARRAIAQGTLRRDPFAGYVPRHTPCKCRHMTREELERFMNVLVADKRLCHTRDMFVFSTFSGLSYADMCKLSEGNIHRDGGGRLWIVIERQKTGIRCDIPMLDIPRRIMEKYTPERTGDRLFTMPSLSRVEVHLNKVAAMCGIERRVTYHQSRHNFGTLVTLSQGVPLETVSQMMGHRCIRTTQIYAKLTRQKLNEDMKKLSGRIGRKYRLPGYIDNNNNASNTNNTK
jgi:site-specific recombinase XerD